MEECPICMELLSGTVVHMGCCKKQVHIQCYVSKCPFCRTELPVPVSIQSNQIIVPIPVGVVTRQEPHKWLRYFANVAVIGTLITACFVYTLSK